MVKLVQETFGPLIVLWYQLVHAALDALLAVHSLLSLLNAVSKFLTNMDNVLVELYRHQNHKLILTFCLVFTFSFPTCASPCCIRYLCFQLFQ